MPKSKLCKFPHTYVLLLCLVLLACVLTYIVPAGSFERVKDEASDQTLVIADSFHTVEPSPVPPWLIPQKIFATLSSGSVAKLIFFILTLCGSMEIIMQAIGLEAMSNKISNIFKNKPLYAISISIAVFSVMGFSAGITTQAIVFIPVMLAAVAAFGFDPIIGVGMIFVGTNLGFTAGMFNPFSVGIAQSIAELPLYSGAWMRWVTWICLLICALLYTVWYAKKTRLSFSTIKENTKKETVEKRLTVRQKLSLSVLATSILVVAFGASRYGWSVSEIVVVFITAGVLAGITGGFSSAKICEVFITGVKQMAGGIFIIGIAATIRTVLVDGAILDTIANGLIGTALAMPEWARLPGLFLSNAILNLLITSGSGHAVVAMPIMLPMADIAGVTRQSLVLAYQLGDGITNLVSPLSTTLNAAIVMSGITFQKWLKFYLPLVGLELIVGVMLMVLAGVTGY